MTETELTVDRIAVGGKAIGLDDSGRVTFVGGAVPTERVRVRLTKESKRFAEGEVAAVLHPSEDRVEPPCPHAVGEPRCGGCDWQHIAPAAQSRLRVQIVEDALRRIGKLDTAQIEIRSGRPLPTEGYRTSVRMVTTPDGRLAYRQSKSHLPLAPTACLVAHPLINDQIARTRFPGGSDVLIRVSAATGECIAVVAGSENSQASSLTETVENTDLRVSAEAFFQASPLGAELLVETVRETLSSIQPSGVLVDAYAGGGLFSATLGTEWLANGGQEVVAIESHPAAVADLRFNLSDERFTIVHSPVENWAAKSADAVIADPARSGLDVVGVQTLTATGAPVIVLISCDAGALGRDAKLLTEAGYTLHDCTVLDLFNHTSHVEVVSRFERNDESEASLRNSDGALVRGW